MTIDWNEMQLFLSVARLGGLRPASEATGLSAPTLGRRMAALENKLGRILFSRSVSGYTLTEDGEQLLGRLADVESAMEGISNWSDGTRSDPIVRISAGRWMSELIATKIDHLWRVEDRIRLEFVTTFETVDVRRRIADIDLRPSPPEERGLAGQRVGRVAHALYSGRKSVKGIAAGYFVGLSGEALSLPAARWLEAHHGDRIGIRGNDVHACLQLVANCAGLSVFPCFVGDSDDRLVRVGGTIPELSRDLWLVTHDERRHEPHIRVVVDRLTAILRETGPLLRGDSPARQGTAGRRPVMANMDDYDR